MTAETNSANWVGRSVLRKQDPRLLTGRGRYVDDMTVPHMLYCAILRSPHAHARIRGIDTTKAKAIPGVVEVLTGQDILEFSDPLPPTIDMDMRLNTSYPIAVDKVRYHGEPVAAVAAVNRYVAEDALEAIAVEYEVLVPVTTSSQALAADAPRLYEDWADNVELSWRLSTGDADVALAESDVVVTERLAHHRYSGTPMEGRGVVASYDPLADELLVHMSTQTPHQCRTLFAQALRIPEQNIRVISQDVGGGFGIKLQVDAELVPCLLAVRIGRPVKWTESRSEHMLSALQARDYEWEITGGFTADGRITALKAELVGNVGCDGTNRSSGVGALMLGATYLPSAYHVPVYEVQVTGVVTNKAPYGPYRGYGKDIANYGIERFMELASRRLGIASDELRRRNFIRAEEFPYEQVTGPLYDSGDFHRLLEMTQEALGHERFRERQEEARRQGRYLGMGFCAMLEPSGAAVLNSVFNGYEPATVRVTPQGGVTLLTGLQDIGQGIETTLAQVVADELTVSPDDVKVCYGDTDGIPYGLGVWSSRGASYGVSAAVLAARKVREKILKVAAKLLEVAVEDLELREGAAQVIGLPDRRMSITEISRAVYMWPGPYVTVPEGEEPSLEATDYWMSPIVRWEPDEKGRLRIYATHPTAVFGCIVEVDIDTGRVRVERMVIAHDCGTVINPMIVEGQLCGSTVQGLGAVLGEEFRYDEQGILLNTGFRDYLAPTAADVPPIELLHMESPSPFTPLGTKGMGEGGAIGAPAVVVNAVEDALSPLGVHVRQLPVSPDRLLPLIKAAKASAE
jgi:carbon-monoxide dehydrogenase large subunit